MRKPSIYLKTLSLVLSAGLVVSASTLATASPKPNFSSQGQKNPSETLVGSKRLRFKVRGVRASRRRSGGISRGSSVVSSCMGEPVSVTALLPQNNRKLLSDKEIEVESTLAASPTFFVHITQTKAPEAEFIVLNEAGDNILHEETVAVTGTPGIISLNLPANTELEVDELYHWFLRIPCESTGDVADAGGDLIVDGWVKRIALDDSLANELAQEDERNHPSVYAEHEIWTDTLSKLVKLRERYPNDPELKADWQNLLESAGLETLVDEPIIGSTTGVE